MAYGERERNFSSTVAVVMSSSIWSGIAALVWPANWRAHRVDPDVNAATGRWEYDYQPKDGSPEAALSELLRSGIGCNSLTPIPASADARQRRLLGKQLLVIRGKLPQIQNPHCMAASFTVVLCDHGLTVRGVRRSGECVSATRLGQC